MTPRFEYYKSSSEALKAMLALANYTRQSGLDTALA